MQNKKYDVLCLPPQDKPVYFVVESFPADDTEHRRYYYEEHSCPTNFFRGAEAIITNGNSDPHGLFEFVRTIEPEFIGTGHTPDDEWPKVLPEAFKETT